MRDAVERWLAALRARFGGDLVSVVVFGSRARGEARLDSDIDLLVVARDLPSDHTERFRIVLDLARQVSPDFAAMLSVIVRTPEEAAPIKPYYLGMLSGHVLLWDHDGFFAGVLDRLRARLAELGSKRYVDKDGYEYWDLKPNWKPGDVVTL